MDSRKSDNSSAGRLSPSVRRARVARFEREAPTLKRTGKGTYGALATALIATVALVGLTLFKNIAEHFEEPGEDRIDPVEVEIASPEDLLPRMSLAEEVAAQVAAAEARKAAEREAALRELASIDLAVAPDGGTSPSEDFIPDTTAFEQTRVLPEVPAPELKPERFEIPIDPGPALSRRGE